MFVRPKACQTKSLLDQKPVRLKVYYTYYTQTKWVLDQVKLDQMDINRSVCVARDAVRLS